MAPSDEQLEKKERSPLVTMGVVMAALLFALLALPFLTHRQHAAARHISAATPRAAITTAADR